MDSASAPKSVTFSSDENKIIPGDLLAVYVQKIPSKEDPVFQSLHVNKSTLEKSTRVVQRFIRAHLTHWRRFNDEKSRLWEELDNVHLIKQGELERVQDCKNEMKREAEMDVALEIGMENNNSDGCNHSEGLLAHVEEDKKQVKSLEVENSEIQQHSEELRKENKRIALDTFFLYESFTQAVSDVKGLESEKKRLEHIRTEFSSCVETLKSLLESLGGDIALETRKKRDTAILINTIITLVKGRYDNRKLVKKLLKIKDSIDTS